MSREQRKQEERRIQQLFARLRDETSAPSDDDLRALARLASSQSRPLPAPIRRRWPHMRRWTAVGGLAVIAAVAWGVVIGVGIGALATPSGTAASASVGTGFLPGPGWIVLQTGADATPEQQALAVAANVRLHPDDDARGIRGSSGLPYSTLLQLPPRGVVIVALFTRGEAESWAAALFPKRELPLRVRDALSSDAYGIPVRPDRPLGQYELRATVGGHHVVLHFYFGTQDPSPELVAAAQRQLDRLVVASVSPRSASPARKSVPTLPAAGPVASAPSRIVDRTFACKPIAFGGVGDLEVWTIPPSDDPRLAWQVQPHLVVRSGAPPDPDLLFVRTRTQRGFGGWGRVVSSEGPAGVYVHARRCAPSRVTVPLSSKGLPGPPTGWEDRKACPLRGRALVRVRARLAAPAEWRRMGRTHLGAQRRVEEASIAVRSERTRQPLAFLKVDEAGTTLLWTAPRCG